MCDDVPRLARGAAEHTRRIMAGERALDYADLAKIDVGLEALSRLHERGPGTPEVGYAGVVTLHGLDLEDLHRHADFLGIEHATYLRVFAIGWEARERSKLHGRNA